MDPARTLLRSCGPSTSLAVEGPCIIGLFLALNFSFAATSASICRLRHSSLQNAMSPLFAGESNACVWLVSAPFQWRSNREGRKEMNKKRQHPRTCTCRCRSCHRAAAGRGSTRPENASADRAPLRPLLVSLSLSLSSQGATGGDRLPVEPRRGNHAAERGSTARFRPFLPSRRQPQNRPRLSRDPFVPPMLSFLPIPRASASNGWCFVGRQGEEMRAAFNNGKGVGGARGPLGDSLSPPVSGR
jgi:hypothetical protein